uniref:hypothetical protein n=1 Tax=Pontibacterium sp. TaxID=2036026 RepID=UPI0035613B2C
GISLNAEILQRLEESFIPSGAKPDELQSMHDMAFIAFQETSDDFEKELTERIGRWAAKKMLEKHPEVELPESAVIPFALEELFGKAAAMIARGVTDEEIDSLKRQAESSDKNWPD